MRHHHFSTIRANKFKNVLFYKILILWMEKVYLGVFLSFSIGSLDVLLAPVTRAR